MSFTVIRTLLVYKHSCNTLINAPIHLDLPPISHKCSVYIISVSVRCAHYIATIIIFCFMEEFFFYISAVN